SDRFEFVVRIWSAATWRRFGTPQSFNRPSPPRFRSSAFPRSDRFESGAGAPHSKFDPTLLWRSLNFASNPRFFGDRLTSPRRIVVDHHDRRLVRVAIERLREPRELRRTKDARRHQRLLERIEQEPVGPRRAYDRELVRGVLAIDRFVRRHRRPETLAVVVIAEREMERHRRRPQALDQTGEGLIVAGRAPVEG